MGRVRPFTPEDASAVARLRGRMFKRSSRLADGSLERYLTRVFCENPWADGELPSLVYEGAGGVEGFLGVVPRPMVRQGRCVRAVVTTQLMVAPESRGLAGLELVRTVFAGPQDLVLADVPNPVARRLWEALGGGSARMYALNWTWTVQPVRHFLLRCGGGWSVRVLRLATRPLQTAADAVAARISRRNHDYVSPPGSEEPLDVERAVRDLPSFGRRLALRPAYDVASLSWLIERGREKWGEEATLGASVFADDGTHAGWFLYVLRRGAVSQLLQLVAGEGRYDLVLARLRHHAWRRGAAAVRGRYDPSCVEAMAGASVRFDFDHRGVLVQSRDPALLRDVLTGNAQLSGLEGEWWMDF